MSAVTVNIKPGQLGVVIAGTNARLTGAVQKGIRAAKFRAKAILQERTPVDTGVMRAAWAVTASGVENSFPLAGVIEKGARPHKVSREGRQMIYEWVRRKVTLFEGRIGPHRPGRGKKNLYGRMLSVNDMESGYGEDFDWLAREITGGIVGRIAKEGYKGTHFVEDSLPDLLEAVMEEIDRAITNVLTKLQERY